MRDWLEITRDPPSDSVRAFIDEKDMFEYAKGGEGRGEGRERERRSEEMEEREEGRESWFNCLHRWHIIICPPNSDHVLSGCNFHFVMNFPSMSLPCPLSFVSLVLSPTFSDHQSLSSSFFFLYHLSFNCSSEDYPDSPPSIIGDQYLPHPNYYGGYLCLNMLRPASMSSLPSPSLPPSLPTLIFFSLGSGAYSGWSPAYSALV